MKNSIVIFIFFCFRPKVCFFGRKFVQKKQNCLLKLKLEPRLIRIWKIRWWFSFFSLLDWKYPVWFIFFEKNQKCQFKPKFGTYNNFNMHNSGVMFTHFVSDLFCKFFPKGIFNILMLPDLSPSSLPAERWR